MKVKRTQTIKTDHYEVGDIITIKVGEEKYDFMAMRVEEDGTIFMCQECIGRMAHNSDSWENSEIRAYINDEVYKNIQKKYRKRLLPFTKYNDLVSIPSAREMFREEDIDFDCDEEGDFFKPMTDIKNRVAKVRGDNFTAFLWLRAVASSSTFAHATHTGRADYGGASCSLGVRLLIKIGNPAGASGGEA